MNATNASERSAGEVIWSWAYRALGFAVTCLVCLFRFAKWCREITVAVFLSVREGYCEIRDNHKNPRQAEITFWLGIAIIAYLIVLAVAYGNWRTWEFAKIFG